MMKKKLTVFVKLMKLMKTLAALSGWLFFFHFRSGTKTQSGSTTLGEKGGAKKL